MNIRPEDQQRLEKFVSEAIENRQLAGSLISTILGISLINNSTSLMMFLGLNMMTSAGISGLIVLVFVGNAVSKMHYQDKQFKVTNAAFLGILQSLIFASASWMSFHEFRQVSSNSEVGKQLFFQELQEYYPNQYKPAKDNILTTGAFLLLFMLIVGTIVCQKNSSSSRSEIVKR